MCVYIYTYYIYVCIYILYIVKHPQFIHLLSGAGRTCPGPISYHAAACPSRGGQWRGLVSHSGVKAEVLLGAAVGESANSNWQRSCLVGGKVEATKDDVI